VWTSVRFVESARLQYRGGYPGGARARQYNRGLRACITS
jgi:hypothetical protein